MRRLAIGLVFGVVLLGGVHRPAAAQQTGCIVTPTVRQRRAEGLRAVQLMVNAAAAERGKLRPRNAPDRQPPYPSWKELATSQFVAQWKTDGGPVGELARKIKWGEDEPLDGWRMHWVANADAYALTMTDGTGRCAFSYIADERETVLEATRAAGNGYRVLPLGTQ